MPKITHQCREGLEATAGSGRAEARGTWIAPTVMRLDAGAAENGPNPINPETLAVGS